MRASDAITLVSSSSAHPTALATPGALEEKSRAFTIEETAPGVTHGHSGH